MYRKQERGFSSDYCFLPKVWVPNLRSVQVGAYVDWRHLNDHCPTVIKIDFERLNKPSHQIRNVLRKYGIRLTQRKPLDRLRVH